MSNVSYEQAIRIGMAVNFDLCARLAEKADGEIAALQADIAALQVCLDRRDPMVAFDCEVRRLRKENEQLKSSNQFWQSRVETLEAEIARRDRFEMGAA